MGYELKRQLNELHMGYAAGWATLFIYKFFIYMGFIYITAVSNEDGFFTKWNGDCFRDSGSRLAGPTLLAAAGPLLAHELTTFVLALRTSF
jgi:hypothetical protein